MMYLESTVYICIASPIWRRLERHCTVLADSRARPSVGRRMEINTAMMNAFLEEFGNELPADVHAVMVLDRAGWHVAKALKVPVSPESQASGIIAWSLQLGSMQGRRGKQVRTVLHTPGQPKCLLSESGKKGVHSADALDFLSPHELVFRLSKT